MSLGQTQRTPHFPPCSRATQTPESPGCSRPLPFLSSPTPRVHCPGVLFSRLLVARHFASLLDRLAHPSRRTIFLQDDDSSSTAEAGTEKSAVGGQPGAVRRRHPSTSSRSGRSSTLGRLERRAQEKSSPQKIPVLVTPPNAAAAHRRPHSISRRLAHQDSSTATASPPHPSREQLERSTMSQRDTGASGAGNNSNAQSRQPTSYPSPHSYPSPSAAGGYQYPPPSHTANIEPYRASPTASNAQLPSLNLPPIRIMDQQHQNQQHQVAQLQQQQSAQAQMGSPLPPPVAPMGGAYYHPNLPPQQGNANLTSSPLNQSMRYPIPNDGRIMSGGRHKKEIKRRTKTGCLTCRKRRIKVRSSQPGSSTRPRRQSTGFTTSRISTPSTSIAALAAIG
jgi:hypothetical protein